MVYGRLSWKHRRVTALKKYKSHDTQAFTLHQIRQFNTKYVRNDLFKALCHTGVIFLKDTVQYTLTCTTGKEISWRRSG